MSDERARATMTRWYEAINGKDLRVLGELATDGLVSHYMHTEGRDAYLQYFQGLFEAFPDLHAEVLAVIADDGLVAGRARFTGTHQGEFAGIPATGRRGTLEGLDVARVDHDGRLSEHWAYADSMVLLHQLGAVPAPA